MGDGVDVNEELVACWCWLNNTHYASTVANNTQPTKKQTKKPRNKERMDEWSAKEDAKKKRKKLASEPDR